MWPPVVKIMIFSYGYQINCLFTKLHGTKQTYKTSLIDLGRNSGLYNIHAFPIPLPIAFTPASWAYKALETGASFSFSAVANSYFLILPSSSYVQGHRGTLKVCGVYLVHTVWEKYLGIIFSGYRQLPVDHLQFSCWCDMCITFSFSRQLHHVIWYIHNICNVIHKTSCGISHTSLFTESQNTKTYL